MYNIVYKKLSPKKFQHLWNHGKLQFSSGAFVGFKFCNIGSEKESIKNNEAL